MGLDIREELWNKLESIPGFKFEKTEKEFIDQVKETGIAIIGQSDELVKADKLLYALRDVTATVDIIPLIASSVMSKKIAAGSDAILLDVTVGDGAFMKSVEDARLLAQTMVDLGKSIGRENRRCHHKYESASWFCYRKSK